MNQQLTLDSPEILACLECLIPATVASASLEGIPNITWLSIVHRLDETHIGLSRQFFRKTGANLEATGHLQLLVLHPRTGRQFKLDLEHEQTETEGPRYEWMKVQLDAIASQSGMGKVFRLRGIEICRVRSIEAVPTDREPAEPVQDERPESLAERLSRFTGEINRSKDVEDLISRSLLGLDTYLGYQHSMLLIVDGKGENLYTVASHGYPASGAGSELKVGEGYIGTAAARRQPVLVGNMAQALIYSGAVRESATRAGQGGELEREIPLPGLPKVMSQLAVPLLARGELLGVLCLQSDISGRFLSQDEHAVSVLATQMGLAMALLRLAPVVDGSVPRISAPPADAPALEIRHFASDDSIFIDNDYLIKGTPGRILWRLLRDYTDTHRVDFSNKEIRLDQTMELPDINDNLEARLILLRRRLEDKCAFMHIVKTGRGRFRLNIDRPFHLQELP
jgi:adenylate cyclase